jgi:hypothetical protein
MPHGSTLPPHPAGRSVTAASLFILPALTLFAGLVALLSASGIGAVLAAMLLHERFNRPSWSPCAGAARRR